MLGCELLLAGLLGPAVYYGGLNAGDYVSTEWAEARNPAVRELHPWGQTQFGRISLKAGSTLVLTGADVALQHVANHHRDRRIRKTSKVCLWVLRGAAGVYLSSRISINIQNGQPPPPHLLAVVGRASR